MANATKVEMGLVLFIDEEGDSYYAPTTISVTGKDMSLLDPDDTIVAIFTYEELRGIMAIMAAHQEKQSLFIKAKSSQN